MLAGRRVRPSSPFPPCPPTTARAGSTQFRLRPETVESLFYFWRITKQQRYREVAWSIFQALRRECRVDSGGYAAILYTNVKGSKKEDRMETFWLGETLKVGEPARHADINHTHPAPYSQIKNNTHASTCMRVRAAAITKRSMK